MQACVQPHPVPPSLAATVADTTGPIAAPACCSRCESTSELSPCRSNVAEAGEEGGGAGGDFDSGSPCISGCCSHATHKGGDAGVAAHVAGRRTPLAVADTCHACRPSGCAEGRTAPCCSYIQPKIALPWCPQTATSPSGTAHLQLDAARRLVLRRVALLAARRDGGQARHHSQQAPTQLCVVQALRGLCRLLR